MRFRIGAPLSFAAIFAVFSVVACATYTPPGEGQSSAKLIFIKSADLQGSQTYFKARSDTCEPPLPVVTLGMQGMLWDNTNAPVSVVADERLFVKGTSLLTGGIGYVHTSICSSFASFVPEAGHTYELTQTNGRKWCHMRVRDQATSAPPPTFIEPAEVPIRCRE